MASASNSKPLSLIDCSIIVEAWPNPQFGLNQPKNSFCEAHIKDNFTFPDQLELCTFLIVFFSN